jgi:hypothetical protein
MPETDNDPSASTASFRAFAQRPDEDMPGRRASSNRTMIMVAVVVCALIVIGVLFAAL